ncbi:MAG: hypothetical protein SGBAC_004323 [Bacillariaceae sp.]
MDNTADIEKARREAIGYIPDPDSKDERRGRKSNDDRDSKGSKARNNNKDPSSPLRRHKRSSSRSSGSSGRHSKSPGRHRSRSSTKQEREDHDAKRRSRRSINHTTVSPGAIASIDGHQGKCPSTSSRRPVKSSASHHHKSPSTSSRGSARSSLSHNNEKVRCRTRSSKPGAVSETLGDEEAFRSKTNAERSYSGRTHNRDSKDKRRHSHPASSPGAEASRDSSTRSRYTKRSDLDGLPMVGINIEEEHTVDPQEEYAAVAAKVVDEDDEEELFRKRMDKREAEIRLQIAMEQLPHAGDEVAFEEDQRAEAPSRGSRKTRGVLVCLILVAGAIVGALYGNGVIESSSKPAPVPILDDANDAQDSAVEIDTDNPTQAPFVADSVATFPTSTPSLVFVYDPPDADQCDLISQGLAVEGREDMIEHSFALVLNGTLSKDAGMESLKAALTDSIQSNVMPKLTGCDVSNQRRGLRNGPQQMERRRMNDPYAYIVGNVVIVDITSLRDSVEDLSSFQVNIILYTQGEEVITINLIGRISDAFNDDDSFVVQLQTDDFFDDIELVGVQTLDPTSAPTNVVSSVPNSVPTSTPTVIASQSPTFAPLSLPTTDAPTKNPTSAPATGSPSNAPSSIPTPRPSLRPSIQPAPGATPMPTSEPSMTPSSAPSHQPTSGPTSAPTDGPTSGPTNAPSSEPSSAPTNVPTSAPTYGPTPSPTSNPTDAPSESPTEKTRLQIITDAVTAAGIEENDLKADIMYWLDVVDDWEPPSEEIFYWTDRYALAVYFSETQGGDWILLDTGVSDRSGVSVCDWDGVSCDTTESASSFVTNDSWAYALAATIPTEMGGNDLDAAPYPEAVNGLTSLNSLLLNDNGLTGTIPASISNLQALTLLDLESNDLTGTIPVLPNNGIIDTCRLEDNNFSGTSNAGDCDVD